MKKKRFGFLTSSGTLTAIMTIVIVVIVGFRFGGILFNPGPLNAISGPRLGGVTSHAELANQCDRCHTPFWGTTRMEDRCVVCHTEITAQWNDPSRLHGNLRLNNPNMTCRNCHPDHRGANASLTDLGLVNVSHEVFRYSLQAHQTRTDGKAFACVDCHTDGFTNFNQMVCFTCHQQYQTDFTETHRQDFGDDCLTCHDGVDTYGQSFNHSLVVFTLTGKHVQATCGDCHAGARTISDLKATPQDCISCHAEDDAHEGILGPDCKTCHTADGWSPSTFDHNTAAFTLTGAHASVNCSDCHADKKFKGTPTDCYACHAQDDAHQGALGTLCSTCHNTEAWIPAFFDHNLSSFKLIGKHASVQCSSCHVNNVFTGTPSDCFACHAQDDKHAGRFGLNCGNCHTANGWLPASFDHNLASFKLTGKHIDVACTDCHINDVYQGTPSTCFGCHAGDDPHSGQFGANCGNCHSTNAWKPASFNHDVFPLTNGHANLSCDSCHGGGVFTGLSSSCASCHSNPAFHADLFGGLSCNQCHSTSSWTPASYNLSHPGGCDGNCINHENASCRDCHTSNLSNATCTKCHDSNNPGDGGGDDD